MELFSLLGTIAINNSDANAAITETSEKAEGFGQKLTDGIATVGKWGAAVVTGATAAAGSLVAFATSSAATADNIDKMSQKIGISRQAYQELDFICSQSGTSVDSLQAGMKKLTNVLANSQQAARDAVEAEAALDEQLDNGTITLEEYNQKYDELYEAAYNSCGGLGQLGLSLDEISKMSPEDALYATIEALQAMPDDANRAALAQDLLGKSAQELAPLLNSGVGSMDEMKQMAHDLGLVLDDELIDNGVNLTDSLDQTKRAFQSIVTQLGGSLMPIVEKASDYIQQALPTIQSLVEKLAPILTSLLEKLLPPLMDLAESIFPVLFDLIEQLIPPITEILEAILPIIIELIETLLPPIMQIVEMVLPLLVELINALLPILKALMPILQPILNILLIFLEPLVKLLNLILPPLIQILTDLVNTFVSLVKPAIELIADILETVLGAAFTALTPVIEKLQEIIQVVFEAIKAIVVPIVEFLVENLTTAFTNIKETASTIFNAMKDTISDIFEGIWNTIKSIINSILGGIESLANGVVGGVNKVIDALNNLSFDVPDWIPGIGGKTFGFNIGHMSEVSLPRLEKGGVLEKGQTGFLEGNGAEAVVPLENNQGWIRAVANDMNSALGSTETLSVMKEMLSLMKDMQEELANNMIDAMAKGLRFDIDNREFARLVKAVN